MTGSNNRRKRLYHRRATVILEVAMVLPLVLLLVLGTAEFARYAVTRQVIGNAVQEGARFAVVRTDGTTTDAEVRDLVDRSLAGFGEHLVGYDKNTSISLYKADPVTGQNIGSWKEAGFGEYIAVQITGVYRSAVPSITLPLGNTSVTILGETTIKAVAMMYSEAN